MRHAPERVERDPANASKRRTSHVNDNGTTRAAIQWIAFQACRVGTGLALLLDHRKPTTTRTIVGYRGFSGDFRGSIGRAANRGPDTRHTCKPICRWSGFLRLLGRMLDRDLRPRLRLSDRPQKLS